MKVWTITVLLFCSACVSKRRDEVSIRMAGVMMDRVVGAAIISDSLKAAVLLKDEQSIRYMVRLPGGGFGFSKQYLDQISEDKDHYRLVRACNVSVVTYTSLKNYMHVYLLPRLPKSVADSFERRLPSTE